VGDSRAVRATVAPGDFSKWVGHTLTVDHKPNEPEERARIEAAGGFVFDKEEYGAARGTPRGGGLEPRRCPPL
jgi:serine/threonine protein phosphatase PrpC